MSRKDGLEAQVGEGRRTIAADGYPMSIGELTSLYRDGELIIRPEFQRLFRWRNTQKSRLIESLLIGIPIPSVFVFQREDGKWELVDGLQRIATILQLQNELRGPDNQKIEPLVLEGTKYLPLLEGRSWVSEDSETALPQALKLDIKRAKIDIKILKRESSIETKFDLFQRLNSFGSPLTPQEIRSAMLVGVSSDFFAWIQALANRDCFTETVLLSENAVDERYDLELILRFLVLHSKPDAFFSLSNLKDFPSVLDTESLEIARKFPKGTKKLEATFVETFETVMDNGGSEVFSRWNRDRGYFQGSFLNTAFEIFALGLGYHISSGSDYRKDLVAVAKRLWARPEMEKGFATGKSTEARLTRFVPLGRRLLAKG